MSADHEERRSFGEYRVQSEIGRGGMGVVYEVVHEGDGRRYALKVLPLVKSRDQKVVTRFRREAEAARRLDHPNIIKIHEFGAEDGLYWFVMDLVEGKNLEDVIMNLRRHREGVGRFLDSVDGHIVAEAEPGGDGAPDHRSRRYVDTVVSLLADIADAVQYSHDNGLIHRDIKPSNLMLSRQGRLVLTDFGLVRDTIDKRTFTQTGEVLGTPLYMSPEQLGGRRRRVGPASDVYSLGVTLYEALTLEAPYDGEDLPALVDQIQYRHPPPARSHNPAIPEAVETIIAKAMRKRPASRYASAGALAADLRRYLSGQRIRARSQGPVSRWVSSLMLRPEVAGAMAVAVLAVVGIAGWVVAEGVSRRRQVQSERQEYLSTAREMARRHAWGTAWRACDGAAALGSGDDVEEMRREILRGLATGVERDCQRGAEGIADALGAEALLTELVPNAANASAVHAMIDAALRASVIERAELGDFDGARADFERLSARGALDDAGAARLAARVGEIAARAAEQAYEQFRFSDVQSLLAEKERWTPGTPAGAVEALLNLSTEPYARAEDLARRAFSTNPDTKRQAINELGTPSTFVRLPIHEAVRLYRVLLLREASSDLAGVLVEAAGRMRLAGVVGELSSLAASRRDLRAAIARAFAEIRDPACRTVLRGMLRDQDPAVRQEAILALAWHACPEVVDDLRSILGNPVNGDLRILAAWALARLEDAESAPGMLALAESLPPEKAERVIEALVRLGRRVDGERLRALFERHEHDGLRLQLIDLMACDPTLETLRFLEDVFASNMAPKLRGEAALAVGSLGALGLAAGADTLVRGLRNTKESEEVRVMCVFGLGRCRAPESVATLESALGRGSIPVRQAAALALGDYAKRDGLVGLLAAFHDPDVPEAIRATAVRSLAKRRHFASAKLMLDILNRHEPAGPGNILDSLLGGRRRDSNALSKIFDRPILGILLPPANRYVPAARDALVIECCRALDVFARDPDWEARTDDRRAAVRALLGLVTRATVSAPLATAALDALGRFRGLVPAATLASILSTRTERDVLAAAALATARLGEAEPAHRHFGGLAALDAEECYRYACVWAVVGNGDLAVEWLTKAFILGFDDAGRVRSEPDFSALANNEPLQRLLAVMQTRVDLREGL